MTKKQLIEAVAKETMVSRGDCDKVVKAALDVIVEALASGEDVTLIGFGTFGVRNRPAQKGRNPRTNEEITVPAMKVPFFRAGRVLKRKVNI
ncbi:MAG: HU family DNA-binding protein [Clostridiaceae bacterium]|nr:HU family DNA-binding protein [Clostridiaceae bacterium]